MVSLPEIQNTMQFDNALRAAANRALAIEPAHEMRIRRGYAIALGRGVDLLPDGTAIVHSQSHPGDTYHVNGRCECKDEPTAPRGYCKHKYARWLTRAAVADVKRHAGSNRYYATYTAPDGEQHPGIAAWVTTRQCWVFTPEDGTAPLYPAVQALTLGADVAMLEEQRVRDGDLVRKVCGY